MFLILRTYHRPFFENVLEIKNVPPTVFRIPAPYERGTPEASKPQRTHTRLHFRTPLAFHHTEGVDGVFGSTFGSSTRKSATFFVATPLCHYMYRIAFYGLARDDGCFLKPFRGPLCGCVHMHSETRGPLTMGAVTALPSCISLPRHAG